MKRSFVITALLVLFTAGNAFAASTGQIIGGIIGGIVGGVIAGSGNHGHGHGHGHGYPPPPPPPAHHPGHGHNGGYQPGHGNHGNHGNHGPFVPSWELNRLHREIKNLFYRTGMYDPHYMGPREYREFGQTLGQLSRALSSLNMEVPFQARDEIRQITRTIEEARFNLLSDRDPRAAMHKTRRADESYRRVMFFLLGQNA